ncbi:MAG: thermonuclease family protein [Sphingomonadaceae bacterium]|nr:thermonuclease family protein [Sphingomonadaceae bacterium]
MIGLFAAAAFACTQPKAVDGDTIRCGRERVRLLNIDAPEMGGRCPKRRKCVKGNPDASKANIVRLISTGRVSCKPKGTDRYGRTLALCSANGVDFSCAQVAGGFAVERYGDLKCGTKATKKKQKRRDR